MEQSRNNKWGEPNVFYHNVNTFVNQSIFELLSSSLKTLSRKYFCQLKFVTVNYTEISKFKAIDQDV